jgi:NAD(P)H-flavin reductase
MLDSAYTPGFWPVLGTRSELAGTCTLVLEPPAPLRFQPGQFNMLYAFGVGEVPISIASDPADPMRVEHTVRAVGAVTRALVAARPGQAIGVRGPFGKGWPLEEARGRDVVFIAGGLGLAPLRPAILQVLAERSAYGAVSVLYGARSPEDLLYAAELSRWRGRFDCRVEVIVDRAGLDWRGPVGVVTKLIDQAHIEPDDAIFVCGPELMMRFVVHELTRRGVPESAIWVSLERSMKCGMGLCGHCQLGSSFVCKDGPVYRFDQVSRLFYTRDL